jgi:hypothetical protein
MDDPGREVVRMDVGSDPGTDPRVPRTPRLWSADALIAIGAAVACVALAAALARFLGRDYSIHHEYAAERWVLGGFAIGALVVPGLLLTFVAAAHRRPLRQRVILGIVVGVGVGVPWTWEQYGWFETPSLRYMLRPQVLADVGLLCIGHTGVILLCVLLIAWIASRIRRLPSPPHRYLS